MGADAQVVGAIEGLGVSQAVRDQLVSFVSQLIAYYEKELVSVIAFGSVVTGDYDDAASDVNLLVVCAELRIPDLERVAETSRRLLRARRFAPRFLSRQNVEESAAYFPIDMLSMRDAHRVLWGEDVLASFEPRPAALRWQIGYEVKAMRMRLKQQFWRTADDPRVMRGVLVNRATSLIHLMRALLVLRGRPAPLGRHDVVVAAVDALGIDRAVADRLLALRKGGDPPDRATLVALFEGLLEMIRVVDARLDETPA
jgi:predicted nucleotidyltransferase